MKYLRIAISALMMILASGSLTAHAQTKPKPKPNLTIWIGPLGENEIKCGITRETINTSATLVLRRNGIDVSTNMTYPYLYITTSALPHTDGVMCSYVLDLSIRDDEAGKNRNSFYIKKELTLLCEESYLAMSLKLNMSKRLSDYTEELLKTCLAKLDY